MYNLNKLKVSKYIKNGYLSFADLLIHRETQCKNLTDNNP